jgi:hypothetical protein
MKKDQKKVGKVMREFKKGELNIGKSSKKVKNPKQAIAIALSEAGMSRKPMAEGGDVVKNLSSRSEYGNQVDFAQFTNPDGTLKGGIDVEMSNPQETQVDLVQGQGSILPEKKRSSKWY